MTGSLAGLLLPFVASRLLYLVLLDPAYLLSYPGEELYRGTIARELVTGLAMPFTEYRADNYSGGSLVIGVLAAGFFRLFGPTVFALKLAPLLLFTIALVFWYSTIQRYGAERVARYFAVLFCFSPPLFTAHSVAAMGFHSETIFFSALTVFLLLRIVSDEGDGPAFPALLGLTAGFGLWFAYVYGLTLLAMLAFWFWHDRGVLRRTRFAWFALGFLVGFSPWILINVQTRAAGFVIHGKNVWGDFGVANLLGGLAHPRTLAPVDFLATLASDDSWDLYRRAVNLLYSLLYLGPILAAGVLRLKGGRSGPVEPGPSRPTLVGFGVLYVIVFALAVQFSDLRSARYYLPAYPVLFLLVASSLASCQERFPLVQRQIHTIFLTGVVVVGLGAHAPVLTLDRPGYALSAQGYAYALLPESYWYSHAPAGPDGREVIGQLVQRPLLSSVLPRLSADDQRELSRGIALLLAEAVPFNGRPADLARIERMVPRGFDGYFYYQVGAVAMDRHRPELPEAITAVDVVRHRSVAAHHLALAGVYSRWGLYAARDISTESFARSPARLTPELRPHYWRALGRKAGVSLWYDRGRSPSQLRSYLQWLVPRLDPSLQRYVLQGFGEGLFSYPITADSLPPVELERFPPAYHQGLLEGWGMALGEWELSSGFPRAGQAGLLWIVATKDLSARSVASVREGNAQFGALFEEHRLEAADAMSPRLRSHTDTMSE